MSTPLLVRCPTCRKTGPWFEGPYGPFCSERCKWVDLGRWLGEEYRISEPLPGEGLATQTEPDTGASSAGADAAPPDRADAARD